MRILISNDDGVTSEGIRILADVASRFGEVWVVAPDSERSAQSHALTMHKPLRADRLRNKEGHWISVSGTPADCVYLAIHHLMPSPPDVVLSGINHGSNLGTDVYYSGTVAAAMEACFQGFPAIAFSLHQGNRALKHWETAQEVANRVLQRACHQLPSRNEIWNVNIPNIPRASYQGLAAARLGLREYKTLVDARLDPRGRPYFWIGGEHREFIGGPDSDGPLVEAGYASVTPLHPDRTSDGWLAEVRQWTDV